MRISTVRLRGTRCFEDTGDIDLGRSVNIFVGQNNAGKSTILRGITDFQLRPTMGDKDIRPNSLFSGTEIVLNEIKLEDKINYRPPSPDLDAVRIVMRLNPYQGHPSDSYAHLIHSEAPPVSEAGWPDSFIIPFAAKRKAVSFDQSVNRSSQASVNGTFSNLYARIDLVVSAGRAGHDMYTKSVQDIVGVLITTKSSDMGKEAGYYFDEDNFVTLDRMGDGVSEMVALIVDLSLAKDKVFVLEEPETNLHPKGLKALLALVRESSARNQFIIATHSNVVVRELALPQTRIFRVYRDGDQSRSPSKVELVKDDPAAHRELLRELGYEFGDFDLHEGWLFLEEASAETIIRSILIPWFVPKLQARLRTFSAGGVTNLEPSVSEFQRLITFVHLEPVYKDRLWVRADGDQPGIDMIASIQNKFKYLAKPRSDTFTQPQFESYYPLRFSAKVTAALAIRDNSQRRVAKAALLSEVTEWTLKNETTAKGEWEVSASEQISLLKLIDGALAS